MFFLNSVLNLSGLFLAIACPCKTPASCKKGYICCKGKCLPARSSDSPLIQIGKSCSSHSECNMDQFCNYGQCDNCDDNSVLISQSDDLYQWKRCLNNYDCDRRQFCRQGICWDLRSGLSTNQSLLLGRCRSNMDCRWFEKCIRQLGLCWNVMVGFP